MVELGISRLEGLTISQINVSCEITSNMENIFMREALNPVWVNGISYGRIALKTAYEFNLSCPIQVARYSELIQNHSDIVTKWLSSER